MTTFEKHYIGKGTQVNDLDIVKVVIPMEDAFKATFVKNGITYLSFEVAKMKSPDKFNRTHTCYYQTKVQSETAKDQEPEKQKKAKKSKKQKSEPAEDDLPF
jgi:hypothetical protein